MKNAKKVLLAVLLVCVALFGGVLAACNKDEPTPEPVEGPEAGVYKYYDTGTEYTLTLSKGNKFTLAMNGEQSGDYTVSGSAITLKIAGGGELSAVLAGNVLTLTVSGDALKFYKTVNYTVTFNANGGSAVNPVTAVNGKAIASPAAPVKADNVFAGWYTDAACKTRFDFSTVITGDITLYALWVPASAQEFTVTYNLGYEATAPASQQTIGGKLYGAPAPERSGYTFCGWWISFTEDANKLAFRYTEDYEFKADTTLFALWRSDSLGAKLAEPLVNVVSNAVSWESVTGAARGYKLQITGPDGFTAIDKDTASTTEAVNWRNAPAGDYTITVTALAADEANNSVAVRYYKNKALDRVSHFSVTGNTLSFNDVGADGYTLAVDCGNKQHNHAAVDLGKTTSYDFGACTMQPGGIVFTVTAHAQDKADSVSKAFAFERNLAAVTGFAVDEATQTLTFAAVENATRYTVVINETPVDLGDKTAVSLKAYPSGDVQVSVTPYADGYNSPAAATFTYAKTTLATPANIAIVGTVVSWNTAEESADGYTVKVGDKEFTVASGKQLDLADKIEATPGTEYEISVRANGANASLYSDVLTVRCGEMRDTLRYAANTLTWDYALGATGYEVKVNDGTPVAVDGSKNSAAVTLTKAGENTLSVRVADTEAWVSVTVTAYTVTFDALGGAEVAAAYVAVGDTFTLPTAVKTGYDFAHWSTAAENGAEVTDTVLREGSDRSLYAMYTPKTFTVTYAFGTGGSGSETSTTVTYTQDYTWIVPTNSDAGKGFVGWFGEENGGGTQFTDEKGASLAGWNIAENITVYAFFADGTLHFEKTTVNGKEAYVATKGVRINLVTEVTIPETHEGIKVAAIAANGFQDCPNLVTLNIPNTIEQITMVQTFDGCPKLQAVNVYEVEGNNSVRYYSQDGVLFDKGELSGTQTDTSLILTPAGKTGTYTIPDGVKTIASRAFANSSLTGVTVPASITEIQASAFADSRNLETVTFTAATGSAELTIGASAFTGCVSMESITLPSHLKSIVLNRYEIVNDEIDTRSATDAFAGCTALAEIKVAAGSTVYGATEDGLLTDTAGTTLYYVPAGKTADSYTAPAVQTIASGAFLGVNIKQLTIPNTVTSIEAYAFAKMPVTKVTFAGNAFNAMTVGDYAFRECSNLTEIAFEANSKVTELGNGVFYDCGRLSTLTLPASLQTIGNAFVGSAISSLDVDENNAAFSAMSGILFNKAKTEVLFIPANFGGVFTWPDTVAVIPEGIFRENERITKIIIGPNVTEIGANAFRESSLEEVEFTSGEGAATLTIGDYAFYDCGVGSIELPARTKTVGEYALAELRLTTLALNEGLEELGAYALNYTRVSSITIPASVKQIGRSCFEDAGSYGATLIFADGSQLTEIPQSAFAGMSIEEVTIPDGVTIIGYEAFSGCDELTTVTIPGSVTVLGASAFEDCSYLQEVHFEAGTEDLVIGASVSYYDYDGNQSTAIGRAFYGCSYLKAIEFPAHVTVLEEYTFSGRAGSSSGFVVTFAAGSRLTTIAHHAFGGNDDLNISGSKLSEITIPKSVKNTTERMGIGTGAFEGCNYLTTVIFEGGGTEPLTVGARAFNGSTDLARIVWPDRLTSYTDSTGKSYPVFGNGIFAEGSSWTTYGSLVAFELEEGAAHYAVVGGILYNKEQTQLILCPPGKEGTVTIPDTVTEICDGAFNKCTKIAELNFGNNTNDMTIGDYAFYGCDGLVNVTLPIHVTALGIGAFGNCSKLEEVTLSESLPSYDISMFAGSSKVVIKVPQNNPYIATGDDGALYGANKTVLIKYSGTAETFTVPNTVTEIAAEAFMNNATLTSVVLPESVTVIGDRAFRNCAKLTSVEIKGGETDLTIGEQAFYLSAVTAIDLPARLKKLGSGAFGSCAALTQVTFAGTGLTALGDETFTSSGLLSVELPAGITQIGTSTFANCKALTSVKVNEGLQSLNDKAFYGCILLNNVELPTSLTSLGTATFQGCAALKLLQIPSGVLELEDYSDDYGQDKARALFGTVEVYVNGESQQYSSGIETITFAPGSKLTKIGAYTFRNTPLTSITLPASVATIGDYAFAGTKITSITLPITVTNLGDNLFYQCEELTTAELNGTYTVLPKYLFAYCSKLSSVNIPASVTEIADNCFAGCTSLTGITLPANLVKIGGNAFQNAGLTSVTIPANVTEIGSVEEDHYGDLTYTGAFTGCKLTSITVAEGNKKYAAESGALYELGARAKTKLLLFIGSSTIDIPNTVTEIAASAFAGTGVTGVTFQAGRTQAITVGANAFEDCASLSSITFPSDSSITIGNEAFSGCTGLQALVFHADVGVIGDSAFSGCTGLKSVEFRGALEQLGVDTYSSAYVFKDCTSLTTVTFGTSVGMICPYVFSGCTKLTTVKLPTAQTEPLVLVRYAFAGCTSITELYLPASVEGYYSANYARDIFSGWTADQHIYFIGLSEEEVNTKLFSRWKNGCNATIHYSAEAPAENA